MNNIISGFFKGMKSIGEETIEKSADNAGKIVSGIITGQDLVGVKPMSSEQEEKVKQEDEIKKQKEMEELKSQVLDGRNVGQEMEQVYKEKEQQDEQQEQFLENIKRQREAEEREREQMNADVPGNSKKEAAKHLGQKSRKAQMPDPSSMSATAEMTGGKID
jgi:hypothetical protein